ncbi:MAG: acyl-CoA dehydrogenase family protein [Nitrososphaerales archaeon]
MSIEIVKSNICELMREFTDSYWRNKSETHSFPEEFWAKLSEGRWFGAVIPKEYGGLGLGVTELITILEEIAKNGAGMASYILLTNALGSLMVLKGAKEEIKRELLPKLVEGKLKLALAHTEPEAGSDALDIKTTATKVDGTYLINGRKIFVNNSRIADLLILVTRTCPISVAPKKSYGLTIFLVNSRDQTVRHTPMSKMGMNYFETCEVTVENLIVSEKMMLGGLNEGWPLLLDVYNIDRVAVAAMAIGTGMLTLNKAVEYAKKRIVFGRPIGMNQGIQFQLAEAYSQLEAARAVTFQAASLCDQHQQYWKEATIAKYTAVEASLYAADVAIQVHGGYGYLRSFDVERHWRDLRQLKLGPISQELTLALIGEHILGLPRSY